MTLQIFGVPGLPEIVPGADLAPMILDAAAAAGTPLADGDVVVVTSKIVSKAENRLVELADVVPSRVRRRSGRRSGRRTRPSPRSCCARRSGSSASSGRC